MPPVMGRRHAAANSASARSPWCTACGTDQRERHAGFAVSGNAGAHLVGSAARRGVLDERAWARRARRRACRPTEARPSASGSRRGRWRARPPGAAARSPRESSATRTGSPPPSAPHRSPRRGCPRSSTARSAPPRSAPSRGPARFTASFRMATAFSTYSGDVWASSSTPSAISPARLEPGAADRGQPERDRRPRRAPVEPAVFEGQRLALVAHLAAGEELPDRLHPLAERQRWGERREPVAPRMLVGACAGSEHDAAARELVERRQRLRHHHGAPQPRPPAWRRGRCAWWRARTRRAR